MSIERWKMSGYQDRINYSTQFGRVIYVMTRAGGWHTLREIEAMIADHFPDRDTQAAISARLREISPVTGLEKQRRMEIINGKQVHWYRLVPIKKTGNCNG